MSYLNTLKKHRAIALTLLIVQAGVLGFAWTKGHVYTQDSFEYLQQAENLLREGHWSCGTATDTAADESLWSRRPPGYALFILLTSLGLNFPLMTLLVQGVLSVFNLTFAIHLFILTTKRDPPSILIGRVETPSADSVPVGGELSNKPAPTRITRADSPGRTGAVHSS